MKKFIIALISILLCFSLVACGPVYEDTNGPDDFTLQTITDKNIIDLDIGSSGLQYSETNLAGISSTEYSAKNFNGVEQIYLTNFRGKSDVRVYIGYMSVTAGNFKLVVINNDKIIHEFDLDTFNEEFWFNDLTGSFSIHLAGESAAFEFHIDIS